MEMFRKAVEYAELQGLTPDYMPELRSENGVLHAIRPSGRKLRLEDREGWEQLSGYAKLVEELAVMMRAERPPADPMYLCVHKEAARA